MLPCIILYYTFFTIYVEERLEFSHVLYKPRECSDEILLMQAVNGTTGSGSFRLGDDVPEPVKLSSVEWELIKQIPVSSYPLVEIVKQCAYFEDGHRACHTNVSQK